ncbi:MAG: tyrosine--tRNA ligase, partial [Hyphomonadaceae bacterium]|nr:tyrosine--tRNA ligase [Hyphomonadaceae bacterium]
MTTATSPFLSAITARGQFHQCTDLEGLDKAAARGVTGYIGFDMTAPSLHVGNLTQIMYLRRLQQAGGKPIVLLGGGTTRVGDPSGKDEMRQMLSEEQIVKNTDSIRGTFQKFLQFGDGKTDAILVDNSEWLMPLNYLDFLRTVGRHMSVNRMLSMDSVKLRLEREQPMSFIEFNYMILQAYDFVELKKRYNCELQMGGSDQWGNIINGVELGRRMESFELFGLTQPLITTASGAKMGKTAQGAVWLNADMVSPYEYWQFWRNSEDADVGRFLKIFTDLPLEEIARLEALQGAEINDAKKTLATEATALLHGREEALKAEGAARATFEQGARSDDLPTIVLPRAELAGLRVAAALAKAGLV